MSQQLQITTVTDQEIALKTETSNIIAEANAIVVADDPSYEQATEFLARLKKHIKAIKDDKEDIYRPAKTVLDQITSRYKPILDDAAQAEKIVKDKALVFVNEKERIERERIRKETAEREEAALNEAQAIIDEFGEHGEKAVQAAQDRAAQLRSEGKDELALRFEQIATEQLAKLNAEAAKKAEEIINKEAAAKAEKVNLRAKAASGSSVISKVWDFELEDLSKVPQEFLVLDQVKVRAAIRDGRREISGIKVFQKSRMGVRSN